jgi:GDP-L-fucose synthase
MRDSMKPESVIFVAGARTFIGSAIVRALRAHGYQRLLDPTESPRLEDPQAVDSYLEKRRPEYVVVAAGQSAGIAGNQRYPAELIYDNLLIATHVIHSAWKAGARRLLYLASSCCYPKLTPQPMRVESLLTGPLEPTNTPYAIARLAGVQMCEAYRQQYGVDFFAGIPADVFGPGDDFSPENSHVVAGLMRRMHDARVAGDRVLDVWGSGTPRREFVYVDDLGDACVRAMERYEPRGPLNLGAGRDASITELALAIRRVVGFDGDLRFDTSKPDGMPAKWLDSSVLMSLDWAPKVSLETGLERTHDWFLAHQAVAS